MKNALVTVLVCLAVTAAAVGELSEHIDYGSVDGNWGDATQWQRVQVVEVELLDEFGSLVGETQERDYLPGTPISRVPDAGDFTMIRQGATVTIQPGTTALCNSLKIGAREAPSEWVSDDALYPSLADALDGSGHFDPGHGGWLPDNDSWMTSTLPSHLIVKGGSSLTANQGFGAVDGSVMIEAGASVTAESVGVGFYGQMTLAGSLTQTHINHMVGVRGGSLTILEGSVLKANRIAPHMGGSVLQTGGSVVVPDGVRISGNGKYTISGGTLDSSSFWLRMEGTGTFNVVGGASSLSFARYKHDGGGVLAAGLDGTGLSTIQINGDVSFDPGALLEPSALAGAVPGDYVLMNWTGSLTDGGLAFAPGVDTNLWSFDLDGAAGALTLSYIPEPGTLALLAIGAAGLLRRKRK